MSNYISECSELAQRVYKTKHGWVWKVIHWELCKKFKFDHANKWYIHNPENAQDNVTNNIFWDVVIQPDCIISARRPDLVIINKK